jgi:hypothetical protein
MLLTVIVTACRSLDIFVAILESVMPQLFVTIYGLLGKVVCTLVCTLSSAFVLLACGTPKFVHRNC